MAEKIENAIAEIIADAEENWDGDTKLAAAATIFAPGVIRKCGGNVPRFASRKQKSEITKLANQAEAAKTKQPATPEDK